MVSPIGLGCWQFSQGHGFGGKFWGTMTDDEIFEVVRISLEAGINWFDTAEAYGWGASPTGGTWAPSSRAVWRGAGP